MKKRLATMVLVFLAGLEINAPLTSPVCADDMKVRDSRPFAAQKDGVFIFYDPSCPICLEYFPSIQKLAIKNADLLPFYLVMRPADETAAARFAQEYKPSCKIMIDSGSSIQKTLGATITPEAFVVQSGKTIYCGRIDNRYESIGHRRNIISSNDLENALDDLRRGGNLTFKKTEAVGCYMERTSMKNSRGEQDASQ